MRRLALLIIGFLLCVFTYAEKTIRVLAIGNSFSEDAIESYLWDLGHAGDINFIIGNAYIPGCSLSRHWTNASGNLPNYSFRKIEDGRKVTKTEQTLEYCVTNEEWDYITFQQVSTNSGLLNSCFPDLSNLIEYVKERATNPRVIYAMHQTWAYPAASTKKEFKLNYNGEQMTMYNAIVDAVWKAAERVGIKMVIPVGTAIQNGRTSPINDSVESDSTINDQFNRDGSHLSRILGRFTASCVWYETLTGKSVLENEYQPASLTPFQIETAKKAAHFAVLTPRSVTCMRLCREKELIE